jgi:hypothetical protein
VNAAPVVFRWKYKMDEVSIERGGGGLPSIRILSLLIVVRVDAKKRDKDLPSSNV